MSTHADNSEYEAEYFMKSEAVDPLASYVIIIQLVRCKNEEGLLLDRRFAQGEGGGVGRDSYIEVAGVIVGNFEQSPPNHIFSPLKVRRSPLLLFKGVPPPPPQAM